MEFEQMLPRRILSGGDRTFCMALSHNESRVFTGREDGRLFSWPLKPGSRIEMVKTKASIERLLAVDEGKLVLLAMDGSITVLDETDFQMIASRPGAHARGIFAGAFDARRRVLVTGGLDGWIRSWQFPSLVPITSVKSPKHGVLSLAIVPADHGSSLLAGNVNGNIAEFNLATLAMIRTFKAHNGPVFAIKHVPGVNDSNSSFFTTGSDGVVAIWDIRQHEPHLEIRSGQAKLLDVLPVPIQDGGSTIWTAGGDGSIGAWALVPGQARNRLEQLTCLPVHERAVEQLVLPRGSKCLISIASDGSMARLRI